MKSAHVNFEDVGDGSFQFRAVFPGGVDLTSPSHNAAQACIGFLNGNCQAMSNVDEVLLTKDGVTRVAPGSLTLLPAKATKTEEETLP